MTSEPSASVYGYVATSSPGPGFFLCCAIP